MIDGTPGDTIKSYRFDSTQVNRYINEFRKTGIDYWLGWVSMGKWNFERFGE
ncbi:hypothetical protein ACFQ3S_01970 [Mucilaginibacter terrae]|uniref:hypothetical protein n=1 Tax=Mucilaginibacter terrae TaxID=1955052 RepID=UPI003625B8BD